jgi:hypothetical protein
MIKHIKFRNINDIAYDINFKQKLIVITGEKSNLLIVPFFTLHSIIDIKKVCELANGILSSVDVDYIMYGFDYNYKMLYNTEGIKYEYESGVLSTYTATNYKTSLHQNHIETIRPILIDFDSKDCINTLKETLIEQLRKTSDSFQVYLTIYLELFRISVRQVSIENDNIMIHFSDELIYPLDELAFETQLAVYMYSVYLMTYTHKSQLIYLNNADLFSKDHLETFLTKVLHEDNELQIIIQTNNNYFTGILKDNEKYIKPKCTIKKQILRTRMYNQQLLVNEL